MPTGSMLARCLLVLLAGAGLMPVSQAEELSEASPAEVATAPVQIDGHTLFKVRGASSQPPQKRAAAIAQRIRDAADDPAVRPDALSIAPEPVGLGIRAGDRLLVYVSEPDARFESVTPTVLAELHRRQIADSIQRYRLERTPEHLLKSLALSVVATAVAIAALLLAGWLLRRLNGLLERRYGARIESLSEKLGSAMHVGVGSMLRTLQSAIRTLRFIAIIAIAIVWIDVVFSQFPWTRWLSDDIADLLLKPLATIALGIADYIPKLLFLAVLALVTRFGLRLLRLYFDALERGTVELVNFEREWALPSYKIIRTLVLGVALVMAYPYLPGSGSEALRGLSVFAGLLLSLGASSSVANLIAGYLATFGRVFRIGDLIQIGEVRGVVTQVRLLTTRVRTIRNEEVTIPNATVMNSSITNFSALARERGLILQTEVGIGYAVPWRQVHAMLIEAAQRTPGLQADPAPFVWQRSLGDFAVTYQLSVYKAEADQLLATYSVLHQNILDVFNEHGVQIMTPAYEGDPETPKIVPREQWFQSPAKPPDGAP
ncbi:MAG: mechanosensitive ion channel [Gammaproteobacteria bacterium]|nr:mechanosensitive ion channel [Gammaproteobacteria bacterium]